MNRLVPLALALAITTAAPAAVANDDRHQPRVYTYAVQLDAAGRVESVQPQGFEADAVSRVLDAQIPELLFEPGATGGVATSTFLRILATHDGPRADDFTIVSATTGPAPLNLERPVFPERDQEIGNEGAVVLRLSVTAEGSVSDAQVSDTVGDVSRAMAAAATSAARGWTFAPETVDGKTVASTMLLSVCYLAAVSDASTCTWRGPDAQRFSSRAVIALNPAARLVSQIRDAGR